jgi:hypothetical protein
VLSGDIAASPVHEPMLGDTERRAS